MRRPGVTGPLFLLAVGLAGLSVVLSLVLLEISIAVTVSVICMLLLLLLDRSRRAETLERLNRSLKEEVLSEKMAFEKQKNASDQLTRLAAHQEQIREDERRRIAAEVHDALGQNLLALRMDVAVLHARTGAGTRLNKKAGYALQTIDTAIQSMRGLIGDLRPAVLDLGLAAAIEWQLKEFERIHRIRCTLWMDEPELKLSLDDGRTVLIFRILQEALSNTARHAQASAIEVSLCVRDGMLSMTVRDNGRGFRPGDRRRGNAFGLMGIKARVDSLGGELIIKSDHGTLLSISIPLPRERRNRSQIEALQIER